MKKKQIHNLWASIRHIHGWLRLLWLTNNYSEKELSKFEELEDEFLWASSRAQKNWWTWKRTSLPKTINEWLGVFPEHKTKSIFKKTFSRISERALEKARNIDLVSVAENYTELRDCGSDRFVGLCPFHSEKNPSFVVYIESNRFYCFGCQTTGDAISFIRQVEELSFNQAVRVLSKYSDSLKKS